ncbi:MAG: hypothetical protein C3F12_03000 [Candidatus Methylomirabilota bacterium]|nr:hypothetical protein [candidate division NC10 bacterium]PWB47931.1 MAG: hypothetical protein C3F12_03000 [candidate division NC10 bacterium]
MNGMYARREAVAAGLLGIAIAAVIWGPVILRPFYASHTVDLSALRLPEDRPAAQPRPSGPHHSGAKAAPTSRVDVNHAGSAALQTLPGIGPTLAGRIITHRKAYGPFANARELLEVDGIGPKRLDKITPWIEVR